MNPRLFCHHGHSVRVGLLPANCRSLLCPICGAALRVRRADDTKPSGAEDATIDHVAAADSPRSPANQAREPQAMRTPPDAARPTEILSQAELQPVARRSKTQRQEFMPPSLTGYAIGEELGRGGMGVVYHARDELQHRDIALKTLQRIRPLELQRFKHEFRSLANVAHPNLVSLYELLSDGATWCFTMELLDGVNFLEYIWSGFQHLDEPDGRESDAEVDRGGSRLSAERLQRLRSGLHQLAIGLNALHEYGLLHRDIKPSNVMVTRDERVVLLDFGMVAETKTEERAILGTPEYMSPEQAAGRQVTEASDWYAVGVMLYEVLTGQLPVGDRDAFHLMARKQQEEPPAPHELVDDVPRELNDLCVSLLKISPGGRPSIVDVLRGLGERDDAESIDAAQRAAAVRTVELVGRERHLDRLREAYMRVRGGETLTVFVHGKSGMGKSVLVRRFLAEIKRRDEAVVLEGRCYEQESVPFKALDSLIDSLADYLSALPDSDALGVMPRDRLALTRVLPVLGQVAESPNATYPTVDHADQQELRQRAMNALRELLQRLAIREPLVLYIDDLQWGDVDSAGLLADLVRPPDAPRMLVLGSYRSEDVATSSCLRALDEAYQKGQHLPQRDELPVQALSEEESIDLAMMLLGRTDETTLGYARKIARESAGWPFFVWELVQHVQDDSTVADQSLELDEVIWTRVKRLPPETTRLLELIAVAARPIPAGEAYLALDAVNQGPSLLAQLRTRNLIRTTDSPTQKTTVESYHDRVRESVMKHLGEETIRGHNLKLAETIERVSGLNVADLESHIAFTPAFEEPAGPYHLEIDQWQRVFDLAVFFDAAGQHQRAFPYAVIAAEQAVMQNALEVAEQQYGIAARGAESADDALKFRVAEGLGEVLLTRGRYEPASQQLQTARALARGNVPLARIEGKLGFVAFKKGDMADAQTHFENALAELGDPAPGNALTQTAALMKEAVVQVLHTYFPRRLCGRRPAETAQCRRDLLRARLYHGLGLAYWFQKGPIPTLWTHLREMNLAERYPPSQELGESYTMHGVVATAIPLARRGAKYAGNSYKIHGELGDLKGQGKARSFQTFSLLTLGRFREGIESGREAVQLLEQAGDVWEANMARIILSQPLYYFGDLHNSYLEAKQAFEIGHETGDHSARAIALFFWVPSSPGTVPDGALEEVAERVQDDPLSSAGAIQGRGLRLLLHDDKPREAAAVIQESLNLAKRRGLRNPCVFCGVSWNATALRIAAQREPEGAARRKALREARQAVRAALRITKKYLTSRSRALRESALIELLQGNETRALRQFNASLQVAQQQEAAYEHAQTMLARGEAGLKFGWPDAEQQVAAAREAIAKMTGNQNA